MGVNIYGEVELGLVQKAKKAAGLANDASLEELQTIKDDMLMMQEAIATIYEEQQERNLQTDEVLATIYETVATGGEEA